MVTLALGVAIMLCGGAGALCDSLAGPTLVGVSGGTDTMLIAGAVTMAAGLVLLLYGRRYSTPSLTRREAVLSVAMIWLFSGLFGALPFVLVAKMGFADAFFEAVSGLTTTGATVVVDIEGSLTRGMLIWRSLIQWLGGMGIVVLFVAVFPSVGAGGRHMVRGEVPGTSAEDLKPRIAETSITLWKLYVVLTGLVFLALWSLGLHPFEALCHSLTTMSTGGFSTRNASIGAFGKPAVEYVLALFMLVASVNYGLFYGALRGRTLRPLIRSFELRFFVVLVAVATLALSAGIMENHHGNFLEAFRYATFTVASTISSTGYGTDAYMEYRAPMLAVLILLMFIGGCSGSTAGGIKVERIGLLLRQCWIQVQRSFRPSVVRVVRLGRVAAEPTVLADVAAFFTIYLVCMVVGIFAVSLVDRIPLPTAFGAMLTCLSNIGPAPYHLRVDNFASYSSASKVFLALAMLLGRLEFFTIFALFVPDFWKR